MLMVFSKTKMPNLTAHNWIAKNNDFACAYNLYHHKRNISIQMHEK